MLKQHKITASAIFSIAFIAMSGNAFATSNEQCLPTIISHEATPLVCFYSGENFKGDYYCEAGARTVNKVDTPWRYVIKSIELRDGAFVRIYNQYNRTGDRDLIDRNVRKLDPEFYNHVWSYRTGVPDDEPDTIISPTVYWHNYGTNEGGHWHSCSDVN